MITESEHLMNMLKTESNKAIDIAKKFSQIRYIDGKDIKKPLIPKVWGIYLWKLKDAVEVVYVGVALGRKGLWGRIASQHLRSSYTKSVFRKKIAKEYNLGLREGSANYILENCSLAYLPCPNEKRVTLKISELLLIAVYKPKYNSDST